MQKNNLRFRFRIKPSQKGVSFSPFSLFQKHIAEKLTKLPATAVFNSKSFHPQVAGYKCFAFSQAAPTPAGLFYTGDDLPDVHIISLQSIK